MWLTGVVGPRIAAACTRMSSRPNRWCRASPSWSSPSPSAMSMGASVADWPLTLRISSSSSSKAPWVRATATTCAPASASARAAARPIPRLAPVTRAMRSFRGSADMARSLAMLRLGVDQEGELALHGLVAALGDLAVQEPGRIVAGEIVVGELRLGVVALARPHGPVEALDRQEAHGIDVEDLG